LDVDTLQRIIVKGAKKNEWRQAHRQMLSQVFVVEYATAHSYGEMEFSKENSAFTATLMQTSDPRVHHPHLKECLSEVWLQGYHN
jgi:hypothetical protein